MALYTVTQNGNINALDMTQIVNELQKTSGSQETGYYYLAGNANVTSSVISIWMTLRSRGITPVSVTYDESIQAHTGGASTPNFVNFSGNGFQIYITATSGSLNARVGGMWTASF